MWFCWNNTLAVAPQNLTGGLWRWTRIQSESPPFGESAYFLCVSLCEIFIRLYVLIDKLKLKLYMAETEIAEKAAVLLLRGAALSINW